MHVLYRGWRYRGSNLTWDAVTALNAAGQLLPLGQFNFTTASLNTFRHVGFCFMCVSLVRAVTDGARMGPRPSPTSAQLDLLTSNVVLNNGRVRDGRLANVPVACAP